ncbi:hypothetical protein DFH06DRAFT_1238375, partial [Mycena polygramma]
MFLLSVFCAISSLFGGGCWNRGGGGGGGGGGSASIPSGPPPIPPCPSGFWRPAGGQCTSVVANCPAGQIAYALDNRPCGCQAPSAALDLNKQICNTPPPNGTMFCETATNGLSSKCRVTCDPEFKYNAANSRCLRDSLTGCPPPLQVASGPIGEGCRCLPANATSAQGELCGIVPYNPGEQAAGLARPGRMLCLIDSANPSLSKCTQQCTAL